MAISDSTGKLVIQLGNIEKLGMLCPCNRRQAARMSQRTTYITLYHLTYLDAWARYLAECCRACTRSWRSCFIYSPVIVPCARRSSLPLYRSIFSGIALFTTAPPSIAPGRKGAYSDQSNRGRSSPRLSLLYRSGRLLRGIQRSRLS